MKNKILISILFAFLFASCGQIKYIPTETKIETHYIDSTIIHRDTISIEIPREVLKEVVYADSSHLETIVAISDAWVDSLSILHHTLANKAENALKKEIVYLDKIQYRDTVITKEIPVPYKVEVEKKYIPKIYKFSLFYLILSLIAIFYGIYRHFKK